MKIGGKNSERIDALEAEVGRLDRSIESLRCFVHGVIIEDLADCAARLGEVQLHADNGNHKRKNLARKINRMERLLAQVDRHLSGQPSSAVNAATGRIVCDEPLVPRYPPTVSYVDAVGTHGEPGVRYEHWVKTPWGFFPT